MGFSMVPQMVSRSTSSWRCAFTWILYLGILWLPSAILLGASLRASASAQLVLEVGVVLQFMVATLGTLFLRQGRQRRGPALILTYFVALGLLGFAGTDRQDWYSHLAQALLLIVPLAALALDSLGIWSVPNMRRATRLVRMLSRRTDWPGDRRSLRNLPEVKALRDALQQDAAPALALLKDPRRELQIAALAALEYRRHWEPAQAYHLLQFAQRSTDPDIRVAAMIALAIVDDRSLIEALADFLNDAVPEVRRAAMEALLLVDASRWPWIRFAVKQSLANPAFAGDGPLCSEGQLLGNEAVADLTAWSAEQGMLALRAAQTLGAHYARALNEHLSPVLIDLLLRDLADPHGPPLLRIEIAQVLQNLGQLSLPFLELLMEGGNPVPLRLLAAKELLKVGETLQVVPVLREIARLPNREIALATAAIVQRDLGVDLGLPLGTTPHCYDRRQIAEITRRLAGWSCEETRARMVGRGSAMI
jgi:HEAT repeat protein